MSLNCARSSCSNSGSGTAGRPAAPRRREAVGFQSKHRTVFPFRWPYRPEPFEILPMQLKQTKARSCRSRVVGVQLEREILALRGVGARLEEAVADLKRTVPPLLGRSALMPASSRNAKAPQGASLRS